MYVNAACEIASGRRRDTQIASSVIVNDGNGRHFEPTAPRSALLSLRYQRRF